MRKLTINKKGQLGGLYQGVLTIAIVGILIAIVMYIFSSIGNSIDTDNVAGSVTGEAGFINTTTYTLAAQDLGLENFALGTVTAWNTTSGQTITSGNYTISSGVVSNASATQWNVVSFNYTYTYSEETAASNATTTLTTQFVDFLPWLGIILLVLAAGIVLFFVVRSFAGGRGQ